MTGENNIDLLSLIRNSDHNAFNTLYEQEWRSLYVYAVQKTGNKDDSADLVQNVFTDLWDYRKKIPDISVSTRFYLRGILVNKIARYFRTNGLSQKHHENFSAYLSVSMAFATDNLSDKEIEAQQIARFEFISNAIDELPEKMRNIFVLSCTRDYSVAEIAGIFDISCQTVKNQVSNALARIRSASREYELAGAELSVIAGIVFSKGIF